MTPKRRVQRKTAHATNLGNSSFEDKVEEIQLRKETEHEPFEKRTGVGQCTIKETERKGHEKMWCIVGSNTARRTLSMRTPRRPMGLAIRRSQMTFNLQVTT